MASDQQVEDIVFEIVVFSVFAFDSWTVKSLRRVKRGEGKWRDENTGCCFVVLDKCIISSCLHDTRPFNVFTIYLHYRLFD